MNKILQLFDEQYVVAYFLGKILPRTPYKGIRKVEIIPHKQMVWTTSYHVVIEFKVCFLDENNEDVWQTIYCAAHSREPRKDVYLVLKFLWANSFITDEFKLPEPITYSKYFNGTFYYGISGRNLDSYIYKKEFDQIERTIPLAARIFAHFHKTVLNGVDSANIKIMKIAEVIPGVDHIYDHIKVKFPDVAAEFKGVYDRLIDREENSLPQIRSLCLIHGDAHPENVIRISDTQVGLVDFSDVSLGDPARDVGCFLQQLDYMIQKKMNDQEFSARMKDLFLKEYLRAAGISMTPEFRERMDTYYHWTAMRTATQYFLREPANREKGEALLRKTINSLGI